jgi:hypothetical protein
MTGRDGEREHRTTAQLAAELGDLVPEVAALPADAIELAARVRDLVDAVVATDAPAAARTAAARDVAAVTERLRAHRREPLLVIGRHPDGRVENFTQGGSGRWNPHAPAITWDGLRAPPPRGDEPRSVPITAHVTLTAAHSGAPDRAHGAVVAGLLDEVLGVAAYVAGASGLTVNLDVAYRDATPLAVPLQITARWTERSGRKSWATGEVRAGDVVTAEATALFITAE